MKHQVQTPNWGGKQGSAPVFFFDGDFRTWNQVEQRAQLNRAIATLIARNPR